jgi:hypothetical protein
MAKKPRSKRSTYSIRRPAVKKHAYQTHVILPDVHCRKSDLDDPHGISRADLFRKLCQDVKPTKILALGDVGEFDAASSFDLDKPGVLVDRDLKSDIDITVEFLERALGHKHKQGAFVQGHSGNHERRLWKIGAQNPSLQHFVNIQNCLQVDRYFHVFVDYDGAVPGQSLVDGILYAHYHVGGAFAKPLSGIHTAYSMLSKGFGVSMCQVHSHQLDFKVATTRTASNDLGNGKKIFGLVAGCFIEPTAKFDYCGSAVRNTWSSGITIIRGVDDGSFSEIRFVDIGELRGMYGG